MIELTAQGSGYFRVLVDGAEVSKHIAEREAAESAVAQKLGRPDATVVYVHDYTVVASMAPAVPVEPVPEPTPEPSGAIHLWSDQDSDAQFMAMPIRDAGVLAGGIYVVLVGNQYVEHVMWQVDGEDYHDEHMPPWSLAGDDGYRLNAFDTRMLSDGEHELVAVLNGTVRVAEKFVVGNAAVEPEPVPEPEPTPEPEPEPTPEPVEPQPVSDGAAFIVGPQVPLGESPWPFFDANMVAHPDKLWGADGAGLKDRSHGYYYDAALALYALHARGGGDVALRRARELADHWYAFTVDDLALYGGVNAREAALSGLMLRAMDGRPEVWPFITSEAERHYDTWLGKRLTYSTLYFGVRDGGLSLLFAAQLAVVHPDEAQRAVWLERARAAAVDYYVRLQAADGGWYWKDDGSETKPDGVWSQPFMVGLLLEGLVATHQLTGDASVAEAITRGVDWMWSAYAPHMTRMVPELPEIAWRGVPYFVFTDGTWSSEQNLGDGWDRNSIRESRQRNSLVVHAFGYAYQLTGDPKYVTQGDEIFAATFGATTGNLHDPLDPQGPGADGFYGLADYRGKEYSQAYRSAGRYLSWRK